jgi:hypothetical protein
VQQFDARFHYWRSNSLDAFARATKGGAVMTDDLVKRLRRELPMGEDCIAPEYTCVAGDCPCDSANVIAAADRIEALEAALRDAYGDCLDAVNKIKTDALTDVAVHQRIAHTTTLTAKDFMIAMAEDIEREIKARAALGEKKDE